MQNVFIICFEENKCNLKTSFREHLTIFYILIETGIMKLWINLEL